MPEPGFIDQSKGQSEPFTINFAELREKAASMLPDVDDTPAPGANPPAEPAVETKVAEPVESADPPAQPEPKPVALKDDDLVTVIVDGEEQLQPWKEAKGRISGGTKFTQNMQALARERKEFEAERQRLTALEQERAELGQFLSSRERVLAFVKQKFPDAVPSTTAQAAEPDASEIATVGQAQEIARAQAQTLEQQIAEVKQAVETRVKEATAEIEFRREQVAHATVIQSTLNDIFTANPVLKSFPNAEQVIRYQVAQLEPKTQAEAIEAFKTVSTGIVEDINKHFKAHKTLERVSETRKKLEEKSIEPPGGTAPQLEPTNFKGPDGQVDWKKVRAAAGQALG